VELELMSLPAPGEAVPEAPMEVPLPVVPALPVVVESVLGVAVPREPEPAVVLLVVSLVDGVTGGVVLETDGELVVSVDDVAAESSFLPQALSVRAAIRARAAHCAIGDLIIRNSLWIWFDGTW